MAINPRFKACSTSSSSQLGTFPPPIPSVSINDAVTLVPCQHGTDKVSAIRILNQDESCPSCNAHITGFIPRYAPTAAAQLEKAKNLFGLGDFANAATACMAALSLSQKNDEAFEFLKKCLEAQGKISSTTSPTKNPPVQTPKQPPLPPMPEGCLLRLKSLIGSHFETSSTWDFTGKKIEIGIIAQLLQQWPCVTKLILRDCVFHYDIQLFANYLASTTTLQELDLSNNNLDQGQAKILVAALLKNPRLQLTVLNLSGNKIEYDGHSTAPNPFCEWLAAVRKLKILDLSNNSHIDIRNLVDCFKKNPGLQLDVLQLHGNQSITFRDAYVLGESTRSFRSLSISLGQLYPSNYNNSVSDQADMLRQEYLGKIPEKRKWDPCQNRWEDENSTMREEAVQNDPRYIAAVRQTNHDILKYNMELFAQLLQTTQLPLTHLQLVPIYCNEMDMNNAVSLGQELTKLTALQILDLSGFSIRPEAVRVLATFLHRIPLAELRLGCNIAKNTVAGLAALSPWLSRTTTLQRLHLPLGKGAIEGRGPSEVEKLFEALISNTGLPLIELNLEGRCIGHAGAKILAEWLAVNTSLQILNLAENGLSTEEILIIASACERNPNIGLKHLNLQGNNVDHQARFALINALPQDVVILL